MPGYTPNIQSSRDQFLQPIKPKDVSLNGEDDESVHIDPIEQYLHEINGTPLLNRQEELQLCQMIERGRTANAILHAIKEFGIGQVNTPANKLSTIGHNAHILVKSAWVHLEEFGLKQDIGLVISEKVVKKNNNTVNPNDSSNDQEENFEVTPPDKQTTDSQTQLGASDT